MSVPEIFNAATYFVDRNVEAGRGGTVAVECGEQRLTYLQVLDGVNRIGNALRDLLGVASSGPSRSVRCRSLSTRYGSRLTTNTS